jgi:hypothetical protein
MKAILFTIGFTLFANLIGAQVPKKIVVEHFTNSRCSICANRNPGFFDNLNQHPDVLHISMYPSSPYPNCFFSLQNANENDGRTNYYQVYGSTPVFVIQGQVISQSANYSSAALFTPYLNQTSPISIQVEQVQTTDSIISTISVKTEANNSLGELVIFGAITEDTVFYASPNGETEHYNVHRKSLYGDSGIPISIPSTIGDSVTLRKAIVKNSNWNSTRLKTVIIVQESTTKTVVQAAESETNNEIPTGQLNLATTKIVVYPNPVESLLTICGIETNMQNYYLINSTGIIQKQGIMNQETKLDFTDLPHGIYLLKIGSASHKIIH